MKGFDLYQQQTMTTHTVDLAKQIVWFGFQFFVLIILSEIFSKVIHNRYLGAIDVEHLFCVQYSV